VGGRGEVVVVGKEEDKKKKNVCRLLVESHKKRDH
jgi:hypothetical protein